VASAPGVADSVAAALPAAGFVAETTRQRYEYKAWATEHQAEQLARLSRDYLVVDPFCAAGQEKNVSLYFDSPRRTFLNMHLEAAPDRLKLRIRSYDSPGGPTFLEVKRRVKSVTLKHRTTVPHAVAQAVAAGDLEPLERVPPSPALTEFLFLYQRYLVEPVLLVSARRLALSSVEDGGGFRLTFDRDIRFQTPRGADLRGRAGGWIPVDLSVRSGHPELTVLIEMKFVHAAPAWLGPAVASLGLRPTSFSKYVASLCQEMGASDAWGPVRGSFDDAEGDQ
jgi:hypothetical protein